MVSPITSESYCSQIQRLDARSGQAMSFLRSPNNPLSETSKSFVVKFVGGAFRRNGKAGHKEEPDQPVAELEYRTSIRHTC